jgi:protein ImuA
MRVARNETSPTAADLRKIAGATDAAVEYRGIPFGIEALDRRLGGKGLRAGALHEVCPTNCSLADDAAATAFIAGIAAREATSTGAPVLWASCRDDLYAPGIAQAGLHAANVIYAQPSNDQALLAVVEDAVRDGTPCAVIADVRKMTMVASRRLQLVAADADLPVLLLRQRHKRDLDPLSEPSAAWSRWRIGSASSARLTVPGVARPRWLVEMARQRRGDPFSLTVEGCDETGHMALPADLELPMAEVDETRRHAAA